MLSRKRSNRRRPKQIRRSRRMRNNKKTRNNRLRHYYGDKTTNNKVIGKIYSNGCGHCVSLAPLWEEIKQNLDKSIIVKDIEATNMDTELATLNNTYLNGKTQQVSLQVGYPTIYKIDNGNVSYYEGMRETEAMKMWIMQK